jgi:DNA-binding FrmR family transcriptional regulator
MDKSVKKQTLRRLSIAEGHLKRVKKMVEEESYCPDVIHQSQAVQAALKKVDELVLHGHLHSCVLKDIHGPRAKNEKLVEEIVDLFRKSEK